MPDDDYFGDPEYDDDYFDASPELEPTDDDLDAIDQEEEAEFQDTMGNLLAHYQAEEESFNEEETEFKEKYGFVHKCRCAKDWEEGNLGVVSVCYLNMVADAMETLENINAELREAKREVGRLRIEAAG